MPRAFGRHLPTDVQWKANDKARMSASLFQDYLEHFNVKMRQENRKVLLLLENAPVHPNLELSNVKMLFFPPNTTAGCQPLDAGIIKNFKVYYRRSFLNFLLNEGNENGINETIKSVTMKHATMTIFL